MTPDFRARLKGARDWVFDLDNTLYPAASGYFSQIGARMTEYVSRTLSVDAAEAYRLQKLYYLEYGATLAGLIERHGIDPHDFLRSVHDTDVSVLTPDPDLADALAALPGRRLVFTNGSRAHADRVLARLGVADAFDGVFAIEDAAFRPKPQPEAFRALLSRHTIDLDRAIMFEDSSRNLEPAHALGFSTVLIAESLADPPAPHIHHVIESVHEALSVARDL